MTNDVTRADVQLIPIDDVVVGERRRKKMGNIAALQRSIEAHGLIHPILLRNGHQLVAGFRRLEACKRLGWKNVPARHVETMSDESFRAIELEENTARLALDDFETSKQRLAQIRQAEANLKATADLLPHSSNKSPRRRGAPKKTTSRTAVGDSIGLSRQAVEKVEKHVALAEQFPFMQRSGWVQHSVLTAGHHLDKLPEAERPKVAALLDQDGIPPKKAIAIIENVVQLPAKDRKDIWHLAESSDSHTRAQAMAKAAALPPVPDPGMTLLNDARAQLKRAAKSCRSADFKPKIVKLQTAADHLYEQFLAHHREQ